MAPQKTVQETDTPPRQVNNILQNLRGEHFRRARNVQGRPVSTRLPSSHTHNHPTLPVDLIYPSPLPATSPSRVPGPSPPKSWRSPATLASPASNATLTDADVILPLDTPAWRARALSLFFSANAAASPERAIYPDPGPVPQLTLLCLLRIRAVCRGAGELAHVVPYVPAHLRRALVRYAAVHAPLSQAELDALRQGAAHVDAELLVVGPGNTLRARWLPGHGAGRHNDEEGEEAEGDGDVLPGRTRTDAWDAVQTCDGDSLALRFLAVLSSPLSAATLLAFPPTITHLALLHISQRIPLQRLPIVCPLLVLLDLSYNAWLEVPERGASVLEEMEWAKLRRLEVVGFRQCAITPKLLLALNRGRWEDVTIVR